MGYDVHITRKAHWFDQGGPLISPADWEAYVATDPEIVVTGVAETTTPTGEVIRITGEALSEWRGHSEGSTVWISYFEGNFIIKNPDEECLQKMDRIAKALGARVQGESGEFYVDGVPVSNTKAGWLDTLDRYLHIFSKPD